jgi:hypothetical protein
MNASGSHALDAEEKRREKVRQAEIVSRNLAHPERRFRKAA